MALPVAGCRCHCSLPGPRSSTRGLGVLTGGRSPRVNGGGCLPGTGFTVMETHAAWDISALLLLGGTI